MKTLMLDPGHGGLNAYGYEDPGAVSGSRLEREDVMRLADLVAADAREQGLRIILTRTAGQKPATVPGVTARATMANSAGADLFVSLHRNAYGAASAQGVEVLVQTTPIAGEEMLAGLILARLEAVGISRNRGVKRCPPANNFAVLRLTKMPAVLVELGFITNAEDNRLYDLHLPAYARAIVEGCLAYLGLVRRPPATDADTADQLAALRTQLAAKDAQIALLEQQTRQAEAAVEQMRAKAREIYRLSGELIAP